MEVLACLAELDRGPTTLAADLANLDGDERARAAAFRFDRDRRRFVARHAFVRRTLAGIMGAVPDALRISADAAGKPRVAGGPHFNVSRSRDTALIVIADAEIGCDIEWRDAALAAPAIAARFFAPAEIAALAPLAGDAWLAAFFECWVRKEAYVKAIGEGLWHPLDGFTVSVTAPAALLRAAPGWSIAAACPRPALHMAVVGRADAVAISWIGETASAAAA